MIADIMWKDFRLEWSEVEHNGKERNVTENKGTDLNIP